VILQIAFIIALARGDGIAARKTASIMEGHTDANGVPSARSEQ